MVIKTLNILASILSKRNYLELVFWLKHNEKLNLKNPVTLNEKIQYLKINNFEHFHTTLADKYLVREYVKNKIGIDYLIPLYGYSKIPSNIDFSILPSQFVMKSNHGSAQVKIVKNKEKENLEELRNLCKLWLKQDHSRYTVEQQYKYIERKIIFEELLLDKDGHPPKDYKIHCFNGKVEFVQLDSNRFTNHVRNFYDINWKPLPFTWSPWKSGKEKYPLGKEVPRPENLGLMIQLAETLSGSLPYSRIDFYNFNGKIFFGEITLHHESGWARFQPKHFDKIYGNKLILPN